MSILPRTTFPDPVAKPGNATTQPSTAPHRLGKLAISLAVEPIMRYYLLNRTRQGYARKRILKPAGHFFPSSRMRRTGRAANPIVTPLVTQLPWTHNLLIMGQAKRPEEREFYLRLTIREKWSKRELKRQLKGALFERSTLHPPKVSAALTQIHPDAGKDTEVVEYAMSRSLTPALIAEHQTRLPDKQLLQRKLQEFYQLHQSTEGGQS